MTATIPGCSAEAIPPKGQVLKPLAGPPTRIPGLPLAHTIPAPLLALRVPKE